MLMTFGRIFFASHQENYHKCRKARNQLSESVSSKASLFHNKLSCQWLGVFIRPYVITINIKCIFSSPQNLSVSRDFPFIFQVFVVHVSVQILLLRFSAALLDLLRSLFESQFTMMCWLVFEVLFFLPG